MARMQGMVRLPPGFRFQPTDEELIVEYLKRKVFSVPMPAFIIPVIQISRFDPWDIPGGEDKEKYFFCSREIKYPNSVRSNRTSGAGFWKATGKEKQIFSSRGSQIVGAKRTLVFYLGRSPSGQKTDWIMHEYRLAPSGDEDQTMRRDWVLCRVFRKQKVSSSSEILIDFMSDRRRNSDAAESDCEPSCVTEVSGEVADGENSSCSSPSSEWREGEETS